jgi:hypothetical protein
VLPPLVSFLLRYFGSEKLDSSSVSTHTVVQLTVSRAKETRSLVKQRMIPNSNLFSDLSDDLQNQTLLPPVYENGREKKKLAHNFTSTSTYYIIFALLSSSQ